MLVCRTFCLRALLSLKATTIMIHQQLARAKGGCVSRQGRGAVQGCVNPKRWYQQQAWQTQENSRGGLLLRSAAAVPEVYKEGVDPEIQAYQEHQKTAARPTSAADARTMLKLAKSAVLSTISCHPGSSGFPFGSVVEFAVDDAGYPLLSTSTLSPHTADLQADGRCSITVMTPGFTGLQDGRFTLTGVAKPLADADRAAAREVFLAKYPNAFYVDFGDFRWFRVEELTGGRYVGGFGRVASVTAADYLAAQPDPVAAFAVHVAGHMNGEDSHVQDMCDMVQHYVGLKVSAAKMLALDRLGTDLEVTREGQTFKLRLPFIKPAESRKGVKEALVEMTKTARAAVRSSSS